MYKHVSLYHTGIIKGLYYHVRMTVYTHVELHLAVVSHNVIIHTTYDLYRDDYLTKSMSTLRFFKLTISDLRLSWKPSFKHTSPVFCCFFMIQQYAKIFISDTDWQIEVWYCRMFLKWSSFSISILKSYCLVYFFLIF